MSKNERAIGVFDSGLGGISVLKELKKRMPHENYLYYGDSAYAPYGPRDKEDITKRCQSICELFIKQNVKVIVIACNTATSASADFLRAKYSTIPIVGVEPALKVAAEGKTQNRIIVMATELTLKEKKFKQLMMNYQKDHEIIKMPCPELVEIVERGELEKDELVNYQILSYFKDIDMDTINSIVLGCTHFVFFKNKIQQLLGNHIRIVDGNDGTSRHVERILLQYDMLNLNKEEGNTKFLNSAEDTIFIDRSLKLYTK